MYLTSLIQIIKYKVLLESKLWVDASKLVVIEMCKSNYEERHSRNLQKVNISPKQKDSIHFGIVWIKKKKKKSSAMQHILTLQKSCFT